MTPAAMIAARTAAAALVAIALAAAAGEAVVRTMLPVLGAAFTRLAPDFRLLSLTVDTTGTDRALRAEVTLARAVVAGGRAYLPDPRGRAVVSTPAGHALIAPLVAGVVLAAWPAGGRREHAARAAVALPLLFALVALDTPAVLAATVWAAFPAADPGLPLPRWAAFLQAGGRIALAAAIAGLAIVVAARPGPGRGRRDQAASSSSGRATSCQCARNGATDAAGSGRLTSQPCSSVQPLSRSIVASTRDSTPSATVRSPSERAIATIVSTITCASPSLARSVTKLRSIFSVSNGKRRR